MTICRSPTNTSRPGEDRARVPFLMIMLCMPDNHQQTKPCACLAHTHTFLFCTETHICTLSHVLTNNMHVHLFVGDTSIGENKTAPAHTPLATVPCRRLASKHPSQFHRCCQAKQKVQGLGFMVYGLWFRVTLAPIPPLLPTNNCTPLLSTMHGRGRHRQREVLT